MGNIIKQTILGVVGPRVADEARVATVQTLSKQYRLIDIAVAGARLHGLGPMDKVKINTGNWQMRTYTPMLPGPGPGGALDAAASPTLRLVIYLHGMGPGTHWAEQVQPGDTVQFMGPKPALRGTSSDGDAGASPQVIVGDETSVGTVANLCRTPQAHAVLEASDAEQTRQVLAALQLTHVTVVQRTSDGAHRTQMASLVQAHLQPYMQDAQLPRIIFTGHAQTIQAMGRALKAFHAHLRPQTKPHWADHKQGLD